MSPSPRVDDAHFLRRVYLDVVGVIPPPDRVSRFLADPTPDKRAKVVAELLASPAYADHWTAYWDDVLMAQAKGGNLDRQAFRVWLHDQFEQNVHWNKFAYSLLTATGESSAGGGDRKLAAVESAMQENPRVAGATNYTLRFRDTPQDLAGSVSKTFLATQIQCAQCHDHKTEKWKQSDFAKFASCFMRVQVRDLGGKDMGRKVVDVQDLDRPAPRFAKNADLKDMIAAPPTPLDGQPLSGNVRQGIATWITQNPWFARAFVNRMWGHFLGRGFVNPVDDIRPSNPAELPALLDRMAQDFAAHDYDVKHLIALITSTEVYQLSPAPKQGAPDIELWSRFRTAPLGPEELVNSLLAATGAQDLLTRRNVDVADLKQKLTQTFSFVFDVDEEFDQARYEGTLAQALVLLNGKLSVDGSSARPGTALAALANGKSDDRARIEGLFLRTVSRKPSAEELDALARYMATPVSEPVAPSDDKAKPAMPKKLPPVLGPRPREPRVAALEDIMWALLNSSEFALNH